MSLVNLSFESPSYAMMNMPAHRQPSPEVAVERAKTAFIGFQLQM